MISKKAVRNTERVCWCLGIALVGLYAALRIDGEVERREAISAFMKTAMPSYSRPARAAGRPIAEVPLTAGAPDISHWSKGRIHAYHSARARVGGQAALPVAVLRIRRVGLEVPVYATDTARNLNRGAVLIAGTAAPDTGGNTAIAAHRDGYFRALKNVVVGDALTIQTRTALRRYHVTSLEVVKPTDVAVLHQTRVPVVTLVTCYPFYFVGNAPRRYIVRAVELGHQVRAIPKPAPRYESHGGTSVLQAGRPGPPGADRPSTVRETPLAKELHQSALREEDER